MVVVNGRIVDFLIDRCEDGYAEFLFKVTMIKTARGLKLYARARFLTWCLACR